MGRLFIAATGCSEYIEPSEAHCARTDLDFHLQQNEVNMAERTPQTFANHVRFDPPFHYFVAPVFVISWIISVVVAVRRPCFLHFWIVIFNTALVVAVTRFRQYALKVQDRVIRLEERERLAMLVPDSLRPQIGKLSERQLIALRFASDEEVAGLVERTLSANLAPADIKKAIKNWRPDYWRV